MLADPEGRAAEAIRALRTHIMAQHIQRGRRALAVCEASPGEGCTFIAANLAVALAQVGRKVALIDADLRGSGLGRIIQSHRALVGLSDFLGSATVGYGDLIAADVLPGLSILFAGREAANPQELLAGERFSDLMAFCLREFEATIVDTPPANSCADARRVSTVVGYSLVVTRRHLTYVDDVKTLTSQLRADRAKIIGAVMNEAIR
jgi:capsular exopolysaccharide synthesis family protein